MTDTHNISAIRDGIGQGLLEAGERYPEVFGLSADLTESTRMQWFAEKFPHRFIQVGVAEQNLIGVAAGLALTGKIAVAGSFAVFSPGRSWDQVRVSVCYSNLNVKIIGGHTGFSDGPDGASHQALEDIAITRVLPNMTVVVPCDAEEARQAMLAAITWPGPCYVRGSRDGTKIVAQSTPFEMGKARLIRQGTDVTIIACGVMVAQSLVAATLLESEQISARVLDLHTIKPIDRPALLAAAQETGAVVTAEEHQQAGGMGSAVLEVLATEQPIPVEMVAVYDTFGESGLTPELRRKYGLTPEAIVAAVKKVLKRKQIAIRFDS